MVMLLRSTSLYTERTMMHFSPDSFRVSLSPSRVVELVELSILRASPFLFELGETTPFSFFPTCQVVQDTGGTLDGGNTRGGALTQSPLSRSHSLTHTLCRSSRGSKGLPVCVVTVDSIPGGYLLLRKWNGRLV